MDLRGQEIKNTYGNVVTVGSSAGAPTTGELTNGQNTSFTSTYLGGNFGIGSAPTAYGSLNVLGIGSAASAGGAIIDIVGTSGRLASIYTEASGKLVLTADPTNAQAGTALEFNVDGTNAMFIDSSQQVGIGTVSPSELLHVAGNFKLSDGADRSIKGPANANLVISNNASSSAQGIKFSTDGGTTTDVFIQDGGNVGIGTASPSAKLDVSSSGATQIRVTTTSTSSEPQILMIDGSGDYISIRKEDRNILFAPQGAERMRITSTGNVGIGTSAPNAILDIQDANPQIQFTDSVNTSAYARILGTDTGSLFIDSDLGNAGANSSIIFRVDGGSEKMRITSAGNVLINNTSVSAISETFNVTGSGIAIEQTDGGVTTMLGAFGSAYSILGAYTNNDVQIRTSNVERIRITSAGDVGIGTATPETKLDVDGDIQTAAPETSTNAAWKLGNVGLGGVFVGAADYVTVSVGGLVVKLPIAIFPETQDYYDRVIADGGTFEGLLGYESAVTILKAE